MSQEVGTVKKSMSTKSRRVLAYIVLGFLTVLCLFWFYLLFVYSTRTHGAIQRGIAFLPEGNFLVNFKNLAGGTQPIFRGMLNSLIVATSATVLSVYFSTMTAYAIHAYDFKGKNFIFTFILMVMMIPNQVTVLGLIKMLRALDLLENYIPLIVPSIAAPVTFYYLKQYMDSALPMALIEAARIDGSGEFRTFNMIALPLMKPAIAVQAIFTFVANWNNYFIPSQIITKNDKLKTVPIILAQIRSADYAKFDLGQVYMTIFVAIFPVIVVYLLLSKNIVGGIATGSVKG